MQILFSLNLELYRNSVNWMSARIGLQQSWANCCHSRDMHPEHFDMHPEHFDMHPEHFDMYPEHFDDLVQDCGNSSNGVTTVLR